MQDLPLLKPISNPRSQQGSSQYQREVETPLKMPPPASRWLVRIDRLLGCAASLSRLDARIPAGNARKLLLLLLLLLLLSH